MHDSWRNVARGLRSGAEKHPFVTLGLLVLLTLGPFLNKAVHIDDPLFIWTAEHIQKHPADFYGFDVNWTSCALPMFLEDWNPPAYSYFLAGIMAVVGDREIALHAVMMLVAFAAAAGIYQLARLWCERPLLAAFMAMATPAFLVSATTLMCDIPTLALWIWAVVWWERALKTGSGLNYFAAGLLAGLSVLTKYSVLTLLPLLFILGAWRIKRPGWWLLWLAVPAAIIEAYQLWTAKLYGTGLITVASDFAAKIQPGTTGGWLDKSLIGLAYQGGSLLPVLFFTHRLWTRRTWLGGGLCLLVAAFAVVWTGGIGSRFGWFLQWQMALLLAGGIQLLLLALVELWRRFDTISLILVLWLGCGFVFAAVLNWTVSARSFLPMVPAAAILVARRLTQGPSVATAEKTFLLPLAFSTGVSLLIAAADFSLANSARTAAQQLATEYPPSSSRLWFEGHAGFQFYLQRAGAVPVDFSKTILPPGEILVAPSDDYNLVAPDPNDAEITMTNEFQICPWLSTASVATGAGFYGAGGLLPFVFGPVPTKKYYIFKVEQPLQFWPTAVMSRVQADLALRFGGYGMAARAIEHYQEALNLLPDQPPVLNNLAWLLATGSDAKFRDGKRAVHLAEHACELTHYQNAILVGTLAAAYAEAGRFDDAVETAEKAITLATARGNKALAAKNRELLELYRAGKAYHEPAGH